jgi:two-component system phosphate regulon sensor histidine kinase PhoR
MPSSRLFWKSFAAYILLMFGLASIFAWGISTRLEAASAGEPGVDVTSPRQFVWVATGLAALAAILLTIGFVFVISRPLRKLQDAARDIAAGKLQPNVEAAERSELGGLADAFNAMCAELTARVDELQSKRTELEKNSDLLETVLETMIEGVVAVDEKQIVLFANRASRRLLDAETPNVVGRPIWEVARLAKIQEVVRNVFATQKCEQAQFDIPRTSCWVNLMASHLDAERSRQVVLVLHDITELRRLEMIRRDFVTNVSHELKTPLTAIKAAAETLLDGAAEDPAHSHKFLRQIEEQSERLHTLILDLLSLARIESGRETIEVRPVSAAVAIANCLEEHATVADSKQIVLCGNAIDESLDVLADREEIQTLLGNLIENAINYTPSGGRVTVACRRDEQWARIDVSDSGIGIPKEHQARIFERFYRVDKARSRRVGGTGLGLAIVKHLVQAFGGRIEVASELGKGSTFSVYLRIAEPRTSATGTLRLLHVGREFADGEDLDA